MNLEIIGVICFVGPVVVISPKFRKREFVLEISTEYNGVEYTDYAKMQVLNGHVDMLDDDPSPALPQGEGAIKKRFIVGDRVKVTFALKGTKSLPKEGASAPRGGFNFWNNLTAFKVETVKQDYGQYLSPTLPKGEGDVTQPPVTYEQQRDNFYAQQKPVQHPGDFIDDLPF